MDRSDDQAVPLAALRADAVDGLGDQTFFDLACASVTAWGSKFEGFHRGLLSAASVIIQHFTPFVKYFITSNQWYSSTIFPHQSHIMLVSP